MNAHWTRGWFGALSASALSLLISACSSPGPTDGGGSPAEKLGTKTEPVFANGDFESGTASAPPPDWTVTPYLVDAAGINYPPQGVSDLKLTAGTTARTYTLQASGPESMPDPDLGLGASLRWPKYGNKVAIVNQKVTGRVVNSLKQTMTIAAGDVDPADGKAHVRFTVAPVLQNPLHPAHQQPFYFVQLRNLTKNTVLYRDFNASAQPGVPWKTVGTVYYTDWQLVDIAPGGAALALGDQVELEVIAAGCAQSGHWGHVYVDGVGSTVPGLFVSATGPNAQNAGGNITYKLTFNNGGTASASGVKVDFNTPPNTTWVGLDAPGLTCTQPASGATGLASCTIGNVAPGSSGSFDVTVKINAAATGTITNGNYSIAATGITALLGPKVYTTVTSGISYADVAITKTNDAAGVAWGQPVSYTIVATNNGPSNVSGVTVTDTLPAQLTGATWSCSASGGATCPASGSGSIAASVSLPVGGKTTFTLNANIVAGSGSGSVTNSASITLPASASDTDATNNTAVDTDSIGELRTLSVTKAGNGLGTIVSSPSAINCGASCDSTSGSFVSGTTVVLSALAGVGDTFAGWSGACTGTSPSCTINLNSNASVTATFNALPKPNGAACADASGCSSGNCVDGVCCNSACGGGAAGDCQACDNAGSVGTCTAIAAGTECRASAGACDVAESCNGTSLACPANSFEPSSKSCRASAGDCDQAEFCTGSGASCPSDSFKPSSSVCRAAAGDCDLAESCTGASASCPADTLRASGSVCRAKNGDCDVAEACSGSDPACPNDAFASATTQCRAGACSGGIETEPASCTGSGASCPPITTESCGAFACGANACLSSCTTNADCASGRYCSAGSCLPLVAKGASCSSDVMCATGHCADGVCCDSACGGSASGDCQACNLAGKAGSCSPISAGTVCRASGGTCDPAESCNGTSTACPANGFEPAGKVCRAAAGDCDVAESCNGSSAACPADVLVSAGSECRAASCTGSTATLAAACSGSSVSCPALQTKACEAYACGPTACAESCVSSAECSNGHYCEAGSCLPEVPQGGVCSSDAMCASGNCVDGVCCNQACGGQCEACDVAGSVGTCVAVSGKPHGGRAACASDGSMCGGTCDGENRTSCAYPGGSTTCREASCSDGISTLAAACNAAGACPNLQTQACAPFQCGQTQCLGDCSIDKDCASGNYCAAGVCTPKIALGTSCNADNQCGSGQCVDGVCCNTACEGQCEACDVTGSVGSCTAVSGAPHGARPACASDGSLCGGSCDGQDPSSCSYPGAGTVCRDASCSNGLAILEAHCNAAGACPSKQKQECAPFSCGATACLGECSVDTDCQKGSFCSAGVCTEQLVAGTSCGGSNQCASGQCVDGVCCDSACTGQCEACDVAGLEGTCSPVIGAPHGARTACSSDGSECGGACDGTKPDACAYPGTELACQAPSCGDGVATVAAYCDSSGSCPEPIYQSCGAFGCGDDKCNGDCTSDEQCSDGSFCSAGVCSAQRELGESCGAANQCASGQCVDGVCCNTACEGQCEACDVTGSLGSCAPVSGAPHGSRPACAGQGACAGSCDGENAGACAMPGAETTCGSESCSNGVAHEAARCGGDGSCELGKSDSCGAYACGESQCRTSCKDDAECAEGHACQSGACVVSSEPGDGGVPPAGESSGQESSCACQAPGSSTPAGAPLGLLLFGTAIFAARRRRQSRTPQAASLR